MTPGAVEVELLGVARLLARRKSVTVPLAEPLPLLEFTGLLAGSLPALVGTVFGEDGRFVGGYVLTRGGTDLLRDADDQVFPGDRLCLLSLSAGG